MPADLDLTVPATTRGLRTALESIERVCAARRVDNDLTARARIVVEELFTNTMKYGYGGECDRPVRVSLAIDLDMTLTYEDEAPPFDPTDWLPPQPPPGERPPGQTGILLVLGLSAAVRYRPLDTAGNAITITLK